MFQDKQRQWQSSRSEKEVENIFKIFMLFKMIIGV